MVVDYDLVVIGGTLEAKEAAWTAAQAGARVALVAPAAELSSIRVVTPQVLRAVARPSNPFSMALDGATPRFLNWEEIKRLISMATTVSQPHLGLNQLQELGVDVVPAAGQFSPKPRLAVTTAERRLTARAYLIAVGGDVLVPKIPGLEQVPWLTPQKLLDLEAQPQRVLILGRGGDAIALAQALALMGSDITLVTRGPRLLPSCDHQMAQLATGILTAAGVKVHLECPILSVHPSSAGDGVELHTETAPLTADYLTLATGLVSDLRPLNLESLSIRPDRFGLLVDDHLRTRHRRIYACGAVLAAAQDGDFARYEAQVAVRNALYLPRRTVNYRTIPRQIPTLPEIAWVGLSERQAHRWYGAAAQAFSLPLGASLKAHLQDQTSGLCKLIVHENGEILGGHWVGPQAAEMIQILALFMQQGGRCQHLDQFPALVHSWGELLQRSAHLWQQRRWQPGRWRRDWAENWFNWRRSSQ